MCSMLDIQAAWSASLCCGPSGSRWNSWVANEVGGSNSTGTKSSEVMTRTVSGSPGMLHPSSVASARGGSPRWKASRSAPRARALPGQPLLGIVEVVVVEHLPLAGHHPAEGLDPVLEQVRVRDHRQPLPALQVSEAELRVREQRTRAERRVLVEDVQQADASTRECLVQDRDHHVPVVVGTHLATGPQADDTGRHVLESLDHGISLVVVLPE